MKAFLSVFICLVLWHQILAAQSSFPLSVYSGKTLSTLNQGDVDWKQEFLAGLSYPVLSREHWNVQLGVEYRLLDFYGDAVTGDDVFQTILPPESDLGHEVLLTTGVYLMPPVDTWGFYGMANTGLFYRSMGKITQQVECVACMPPGPVYHEKTIAPAEKMGAVFTAGAGVRYDYSTPDQFFAEFRTVFLTNVNEMQLQIIGGVTF